MKDVFHRWLDQRSGLPGILACGVRFPDRSSFGRSNASEVAPELLDRSWNQVAEAMTALTTQRFTVQRALWTFTDGQLHCAARSDGVVLTIVTPATTSAYNPNVIDKLIAEFLDLRPA